LATRRVPFKVFDEAGNETVKEINYRSVVDERTGMVQWQMEPGQDISGDKLHVKPDLRLVSIGGGTGQPIVLKGLKRYLFPESDSGGHESYNRERLTAIVTMTDDGGSSGRLRNDLNVPPPGDVRNCLIGLSEDEGLMNRLLKYRFAGDNGLAGHSLGNLILAALSEGHQNFHKAVCEVSSILAIKGEILPSTVENAVLRAELEDGSIIEGETRINTCSQRIRRVMIEPKDIRPLDQALSAIERASGIVIGPGSLYTSILPNLVTPGVAEAIVRSKAIKILIANIMTEPEETRGFTVADHLNVIEAHVGSRVIDHVVINKTPVAHEVLELYKQESAEPTRYDMDEIKGLGVNPVEADLLLTQTNKVRHDYAKLAFQILRFF
jgi:uncharacterized cofD-like protein